MLKTTVYLPERVKRRLAAVARRRRTSEAQLIREGIERVLEEDVPRRPTYPLFRSGNSDLWQGTDRELLKGFGER